MKRVATSSVKVRACVAFDRDVIVVVNPAQIRELQVPGKRGGLAGDALHHASVSAKRVDVEVEEILEARAVVTLRQPLPADSHAHAGGQALAKRPCCGFHARRPAVLRMSRTTAAQLSKGLDGVQWHRYLAQSLVVLADRPDFGQMKQGIEQHGRVPGRQHEAVPVRPYRVLRIEPQELLPESVGNRRHPHGSSGMPRVGRLDCIHAKRTDCVDADRLHRWRCR